MSATTAPSSLLASSVLFAGGLAVGIGGALALSRTSFQPAIKPSRAIKERANKQLAVVRDSAKQQQQQQQQKDRQLDVVAATDDDARIVKPELKSLPKGLSVTGRDVAQANPQPKATHRDVRTDFATPLPSEVDAVAEAHRQPLWLTGLPESTLKATSQGVVETLAYRSSNALFVYEAATNAGFGSWAEREAADAARKGLVAGRPNVMSMQTRSGAGSAIAGYLAERGGSSLRSVVASTNSSSSSDAVAVGRKVVSALTNAQGLLSMAPALSALPANDARLVLQVSAAAQDAQNLDVANDYAAVLAAAATISAADDRFAVLLSSGRQEAVDVASATYAAGVRDHVAHVFDGAFAAREVAPLKVPDVAAATGRSTASVVDALAARGLGRFAYAGPANPTTLLVVPNGSHFAGAAAVLAAVQPADATTASVGVLGVRVLRPWSDAELLEALPESVRVAHVLDETRVAGAASGVLLGDVAAAVLGALGTRRLPIVEPLVLRAGQHLGAAQWQALLAAAAKSAKRVEVGAVLARADAAPAPAPALLASASGARVATFVDSDASATAETATLVARTLRERSMGAVRARLLSRYDNFAGGGAVRSDVVVGGDATLDERVPVDLAAQASGASTLVVGDVLATLKTHDAFASLAPGGAVLLHAPGVTGAELDAKLLRASEKRTLAARRARVYLVDSAKVVAKLEQLTAKAKGAKAKLSDADAVPKELAAAALAVAFLRAHLGASADAAKALLSRSLGVAPLGAGGVDALVDATFGAIELVAFSDAQWASAQPASDAEEKSSPPPRSTLAYNAFGANGVADELAAAEARDALTRATWAQPALQTMFPEAYDLKADALRPDLPDKTWTVKVTENRRLTPLDYDRNVFHIEFTTEGTDLRYEIGEALGVHGWNDAEEVREFLAWAGYDADEVVSVPSALSPATRHTSRTVFQLVQQVLDVFGKPGKAFYEELAKLATDADEARWLRFISSAEGSSTFKKLADVETVTYADVLRMFPSAKLSLAQLARLVEPIKPRHYSIASAQDVVGDKIHLLVVTVDWVTPSGSPRYGQCTRYLANLKVGDEVTVSLKPSVMKLPPHPTQPIIMCGLGTGAAPFRAYYQARELQATKGEEIGPVYYCFGARHRHQEFLYGNELEALAADGVVSHLRTAFSRDQARKIYVQHRLVEDAAEIAKWLLETDPKKQGYFFLCGPTWPVPDVHEALIQGLEKAGGLSRDAAARFLDELKEQERYVLEVY